jgi:hypothetical protein
MLCLVDQAFRIGTSLNVLVVRKTCLSRTGVGRWLSPDVPAMFVAENTGFSVRLANRQTHGPM